MAKKLKVAFVGAGSLASAVAAALADSGVQITEIVSRDRAASIRRARELARRVGAAASTMERARFEADVLWVCVTDSAIRPVSDELAAIRSWNGAIVLHASGALGSDELSALKKQGAWIGSLHPMMSFVRGVRPNLAGITFAAEGDECAVRTAKRIVRKLHGRFVLISNRDKVLYHAFGAFCSPLMISELATAESVAARIGLTSAQARAMMAPILQRTLQNYLERGAAAALSGPIARGDAETVRRHVAALQSIPSAQDVYLSLSRAALETLPSINTKELQAALGSKKKKGSAWASDRRK